MAKYTMIEVLEKDSIGLFSKINVYYDDGTVKEFNNKADCSKELDSFAEQEEISIGELIMSGDKVRYNLHTEPEPELEPKLEDEEESEYYKISKKKVVTGIKIVASVAALTVMFVGGYHLCKYKGKKVSNHNEINQESNVYSQNTSYEPVVTFAPNVHEEPVYYEPVAMATPNVHEEPVYYEPVATSTPNVHDDPVYDDTNHIFIPSYIPESDYLGAIEYVDELCLYNSPEIGEYMEGKELSGEPLFIKYQNLFEYGSTDYYAVEYFSRWRDDYVRSAYFDNNRNNTNNAIDIFCNKAAGFSAGDETISFNAENGQTMTLSKYDLSPAARHVICVMTMGAYNINDDTYVTYNSNNNSPDVVRKELSDEYNNTMVELNNRYSR